MRNKNKAELLIPALSAALLLLFHSCDMIDPPMARINPNDPFCPVRISYITLDTYASNYPLSFDLVFPYFDDSWSKDDLPEAFFVTIRKNDLPDDVHDGSSPGGFYRIDLTDTGTGYWYSDYIDGFNIRDFESWNPAGAYYLSVYWTIDYKGNDSDLINGNLDDNTEWLGPVRGVLSVDSDGNGTWYPW